MALRKPSRDQLRYLRLATVESEASNVARYFYMGVSETHREGEEVDPGWLDLWDRWSSEIDGFLPQPLYEEIAAKMATVSPIDEEISRIALRDEDKVAVLLGAGASFPPPSGIPTVLGLLPELLGRAKKLGRDEIDKLVKWCDDNRVTNIEDLLTAAYVADFAAKRPSVTGLLNYFLSPRRESDPDDGYRPERPVVRRTGREIAAGISHLQETLQTLFGLLTSRMLPAKPNPAHEAIV